MAAMFSITWIPAAMAVVVAIGVYLYQRLVFYRFHQYAEFPQLKPSLILGHMRILADHAKKYDKPALYG